MSVRYIGTSLKVQGVLIILNRPTKSQAFGLNLKLSSLIVSISSILTISCQVHRNTKILVAFLAYEKSSCTLGEK